MKLIITTLSLFIGVISNAQQIQKLDFCNCIDKVDQMSPVLNGKYERICDDKVNETGSFKDGNKSGEWVTYGKKGTVIKRINYNDGKLDGKAELFYTNGKTKLTASFKNGRQDGEWIYYTSSNKILIQGEYDNGKPIKIWNVYNGAKPVIQYDFSLSKYIMNGKPNLRKEGSFMRNDNSGEYFFFFTSPKILIDETAPLGGQNFAVNLLLDLHEIPLDYWDTYISYEYLATVSVSEDHQSSFSISRYDGDYDMKEEVVYPFLVQTNPESKLKKVDHTDLSRKLLDFKINETFSFLPPWIFTGKKELKVHLPYVINRLVDLSKPTERKYN